MRKYLFLLLLFLINVNFARTINVVGVTNINNNNSRGIITQLSLTTEKGDGKIFFNINKLTQLDTQVSVRLANEVACELTNVNCSKLNFYYSLNGNFPKISGPSAGAAMTILTLSELNNEDLRSNVAITGTINPDKSIGNVGGVKEKLLAAQDNNIKYFLIPFGEKKELENNSFNISVVEVSTIKQAYYFFTGKDFINKEYSIDNKEYNNFMRKMSLNLINYSNNLFFNLNNSLNSYNLTIIQKEIVNNLFNQTIIQRDRINNSLINNNYYSAASFSVGVSLNSLYLSYLLDYFKNNYSKEYEYELLNNTIKKFDNFKKELYSNITIDNINDLEAINIVIDRFFEANELLTNSNNSLINNNSYNFLYNIAFANVRLKTAQSWKTLINEFKGNLSIKFNQDDFKDFALNRIQIADSLYNYANTTLPIEYTNNAKLRLDSSKQAYYNKDYIYSIFESLKSISELNYAMEVNGFTIDTIELRINLSESQARENINITQTNNITPILALSYYEYSKEFKKDNPIQSLIFLEYSKQFALLTEQMSNQIYNNVVNIDINNDYINKGNIKYLNSNFKGFFILFFFIIFIIIILKGIKF